MHFALEKTNEEQNLASYNIDVNMSKHKKITFYLYRKPTDIGLIRSFCSSVPFQHIKNLDQGTAQMVLTRSGAWIKNKTC